MHLPVTQDITGSNPVLIAKSMPLSGLSEADILAIAAPNFIKTIFIVNWNSRYFRAGFLRCNGRLREEYSSYPRSIGVAEAPHPVGEDLGSNPSILSWE